MNSQALGFQKPLLGIPKPRFRVPKSRLCCPIKRMGSSSALEPPIGKPSPCLKGGVSPLLH